MGWLNGLRARLRATLRPRALDRELDEEIRGHLEMETAKNIADGLDPAEARRLAVAVFGGGDSVREGHRDVRPGRWITDAAGDVRYAFRTLRHNPALTAAAMVTLALGVGANTAIFSSLYAVVLRPLPFRESDRLVMLWERNAERGWFKAEAAPANYLDWREQVTVFEDVAAYPSFETSTVLSQGGETQLLSEMIITGNFFTVLGVPAAVGRTFTDAETWESGERLAMISHRLWRSSFGGDSSIVDRTIDLGGYPVRVIGIVPAGFTFPGRDPDVWRPMSWSRRGASQVSFRRAHFVRVIARMRPGVTPAAADAALQVVVKRLEADYPATNTGMGAGLTSLHAFLVGDVRSSLVALQAAVALLLLLACANVGNLLLVRAADRERESVLRLALGAGRGRLVRQAMAESLVLSALGGIVGVGLGWAGTRLLAQLRPERMLPVGDVGMDPGVLLFALAVTMVSGLLFGVGPAAWASRRAPADVLKEGGRGASRTRIRRWSHTVAVGEVAIAVILTAGAGLLVRSWWQVQGVDPGVDTSNVLTASVALPPGLFEKPDKREAYFKAAVERLQGIPGIRRAATASQLPITVAGWSSDFAVAGRPREAFGVEVVHRDIAPAYHEVMGVPLRLGRGFTDADNAQAPPVVLINETLARKYFATDNPIGQRVAFDRYPDSTSYWRTIVGVVGSERQVGLESEARPEFFTPVAQREVGSQVIVLRTTVDPGSLVPAVRSTLAGLDRNVAVSRITPMSGIREAALARRRFVLTLVLVFAAVGFLLALVGVYGVMAQLALGRRREIGIRVALGAPLAGIQMLVVRRGLGLALLGVSVGTAASVAMSGSIRALLFGVSPQDPVTLGVVAALLTGTAVAASWPPAMRAARTDPCETLRAD